ncbi:hypothetical protein PWG14_19905 (plasmid) [Chromobacterium amazonense]|uniref:hypothetical protein n=1 Tax=Chromobacterium amazonense TaxID=1382803 RepID=UPI00237DC958|nr:hypothetical protein [Chromobacterium amazonense]MDE1714761.1 hypothetical protein [Chromobacterium amazonense]
MSVLSELNTLLEKIPLWKRLQSMPQEIDELRKRIEQLESSMQPKGHDSCPKCHQRTFELVRTEPDPVFRKLGVQRRVYECSSCHHSEFQQLK